MMIITREYRERFGPYSYCWIDKDDDVDTAEVRKYVEAELDDDSEVRSYRFIRTDHATQQECNNYNAGYGDGEIICTPDDTKVLEYIVIRDHRL